MKSHNEYLILTKEFIFEGKYYLYDTYTNTLLQITKGHYIAIKKFKEEGFPHYNDLPFLSSFEKDILMLKNRGMFSFNIVNEVVSPYLPYVESFIAGSINEITLQVTKMCNFDCRYCLFAGEEGIERTHENTYMSLETAYKCVDFLHAHSCDANKLNISFYGGEPLLNFDLIKNVVMYAKTRFYSKPIEYSMTINGSLLSEDIIDFLVDNNFKISISLDGPENIQNLHRLFRNTGKGTFDVVMSNVNNLKDKYPNFFQKNVTFMPVVIDNENYETVSSFFIMNGIQKRNIIPLKANLNGIDYYLSSSSQFQNSSTKNMEKASEGINAETITSLKRKYDIKDIIPNVWHHNGQCIPGIQRIFVDCSGNIFPCEKIVENKAFIIGNIEKGFDISKIKEMISIGNLSESRCKNCWAMRFCDICVSLCLDVDSGSFCDSVKKNACKAQEENALWIFKKIIKGYCL